ncbi:MAG: carboxymuconolactone decarboxylase family protein [Ignavibacteria bacterium]|nr:carboxymuconolactone decarboxylase family protein [Ignavibacteria bacterium]
MKKSGENNCKLIYKNNYNKLLENMNRLSPEMKDWMLFEGYGKVMSRPGLNLYEREFITISILTVRYFEFQLHSHLKGCIHLGADVDLIKDILFSIKDIAGVTNYKKALKLLSRIHKPVK